MAWKVYDEVWFDLGLLTKSKLRRWESFWRCTFTRTCRSGLEEDFSCNNLLFKAWSLTASWYLVLWSSGIWLWKDSVVPKWRNCQSLASRFQALAKFERNRLTLVSLWSWNGSIHSCLSWIMCSEYGEPFSVSKAWWKQMRYFSWQCCLREWNTSNESDRAP